MMEPDPQMMEPSEPDPPDQVVPNIPIGRLQLQVGNGLVEDAVVLVVN